MSFVQGLRTTKMTKRSLKKIFKIVGIIIGLLTIGIFGFGFYFYKTNPIFKAIVNNDESKLFYFPSKKMSAINDLDYSEKVIEVDDSINIYTYQFKTISPKKANIFLIHGGGGNISTYQDLIRPLVKNGFAVYAFDWRGFGKSNGIPNYKGVLEDTEVAFKDFLNMTKNDTVKTVVYGMSLGGQLAVKISKENQTKINLLVLDGSIESAQSLAYDFSPISFLKEKAKNSPQDFNQEYVAVKDIKYIENIPKIIIQSKIDQNVPLIRGKHLFDAAKEPKTFWETNTEHIMTLVDLSNETIEKQLNNKEPRGKPTRY